MPEIPELQFLALSSGQRLAWREWGTGTPLIMLHGWSMSSVVFVEVAEALAADYRVVCPDLPGHGQSEPLPLSSLESFAAAIAEWARLVAPGSVDLLGWSLGGQVAMQIAADKMLSLRKLLLTSTTPRFCQGEGWTHGLPKTQLKALERNLERAYEKTLGDFFALQFVDELLPRDRYRQIVKFAVRSGRLPEAMIARAALSILGQADQRDLLKEIAQSVLIVHGELDRIVPVGAGEYLATELPNAQFLQLSGVGHAPFFSCPELCVRQWRKFLK